MHHTSTRMKAVRLREQGYAFPYISKKLGISKSTLSGWLSDVAYQPNEETLRLYGKARAAAQKRKAEILQEEIAILRNEAEKTIGTLSERDVFMFGLGLYLGEGSKTHNTVRVVNADPAVICSAIAWFKALGVQPEQFAPRLHLYPDSDESACLQFWSKATKIPRSRFLTTQVDRRTNKKVHKRGKLPFGTLHLGVRSSGQKEFGARFLRRIRAWSDCVTEQTNTAGLV